MARVWRREQNVRAVRAAQGKTESARTFNTFSGAHAIAKGAKKQAASSK
jgi:hypothetical protein